MNHAYSSSGAGGFTLIELMITLLVVAILSAIAYPIYEHQVQESRRTEARTALLELAAREERYYATNSAYTTSASLLGYTSAAGSWPIVIGSGYYEMDEPAVPASGISAPSFSLTAVPVASGPQASDSTCASFTVDSTGQETAADSSGGDTSSTCW